jgi:hypothetical protein
MYARDSMIAHERPRWLSATAVCMSITNALGWAIIDWSRPDAKLVFAVFTITILIGYVVVWFYWRGKNWARILVLLTSLLCFYNLRYWTGDALPARIMSSSEAWLAVFLVYWLNTRTVREFFRSEKSDLS